MRKIQSKTKLIELIEPTLRDICTLKVGWTTLCRRGDPTEWYYDAVNQIRDLELGQRKWNLVSTH